jgi:hypothetical protein
MQEEDKYYPLPTQSLPGLKLADHISDIIEIKNFIESRGIETRNTRIERYCQYLTEVLEKKMTNAPLVFKNSADARFKSSTDWLLYVLRETHELMWILRGLKIHIPAGIDSRLQMLVSGSDFAALDTNTRYRDVQFELRIASYFCQAGCEVDLTTNTDVVAVIGKYAFYVECKRVGSVSQVHRRLAEAAKQLHREMPGNSEREVYGCIAVDVTKAAFNHNGLTFAQTDEHSRDIIQKNLIKISDGTLNMSVFSRDRKILQYWLQIHLPSLIMQPPSTTTRFSSYYVRSPRIHGESAVALSVLDGICSIGNKRDEREVSPRKLTPRTSLSLPTGTSFQVVDEALLKELLENGQIASKSEEYVVAELNFNGLKHEFTCCDLEAMVASVSKSEMARLSENIIQAKLEMVIKMYLKRYPYENSE